MAGRGCDLPEWRSAPGSRRAEPNVTSGAHDFIKPADNIGEKAILNHDGYVNVPPL